jgi:hypothetical protein
MYGSYENEGHRGLKNEKVNEVQSRNFQTALSYLVLDENTAKFVLHAYSNTYSPSQYIQRSDIQPNGRRNFLEKLGFTKSNSCNVLSGGKCYFKVVEIVDRGRRFTGDLSHMQRNDLIHDAYRKFATNLNGTFSKMEELDKMLFDMGMDFPGENMRLAPVEISETEKVYAPGFQYDIYRDLVAETKKATKDILVIDAYPSEELINLYLDKVQPGVTIRVLTAKNENSAFPTFLTVVTKLAKRPNTKIEVRENPLVHDRLYFIDGQCYLTGASLKDAAVSKPTYFIKVNGSSAFSAVFEPLWQTGTKLV